MGMAHTNVCARIIKLVNLAFLNPLSILSTWYCLSIFLFIKFYCVIQFNMITFQEYCIEWYKNGRYLFILGNELTFCYRIFHTCYPKLMLAGLSRLFIWFWFFFKDTKGRLVRVACLSRLTSALLRKIRLIRLRFFLVFKDTFKPVNILSLWFFHVYLWMILLQLAELNLNWFWILSSREHKIRYP